MTILYDGDASDMQIGEVLLNPSKFFRTVRCFEVPVKPMGAPRMSQRDRNPGTMSDRANKYFAYCDMIRQHCGQTKLVPGGSHLAKWSSALAIKVIATFATDDESLVGTPHTLKPDEDNISKGVKDALLIHDEHCFMSVSAKVWAHVDMLTVYIYNLEE